jgi:hypothetical protein
MTDTSVKVTKEGTQNRDTPLSKNVYLKTKQLKINIRDSVSKQD